MTRPNPHPTHLEAVAHAAASVVEERDVKRDTRSAYRARAAATERSIDAAVAAAKTAEAEEQAKRTAIYAERTKPVPFTHEELRAARVVRTYYGWQRVIRVNTTTVTVAGDFGDYKVPEKSILEVRA